MGGPFHPRQQLHAPPVVLYRVVPSRLAGAPDDDRLIGEPGSRYRREGLVWLIRDYGKLNQSQGEIRRGMG